MPVIRTGYALGIVGPLVTAAGCNWRSRRARVPRVSGSAAPRSRSCCSRAPRPPRCSRRSAARAACRSCCSPSCRARSGGRSSSARCSRAAISTRTTSRCRGSPPGCSRSPGSPSRSASGATRATCRQAYVAPAEPRPLGEILRRPGVATAMVAAVSSFGVMAGVMNLAGYVAVGHHHPQGSVFTIISIHIVGHVRARAVRRRRDRADRPAALDGDRPRA